jgi:hypothetical protein
MEEAYVWFHTKRFQRPYAFLHPATWAPRQIEECGYEEAFVAGPRNSSATFSASLVIRSSATSHVTLADAADAFVSRYHSAFRCRVTGQASGTLGPRPAEEREIAYTLSLPLNSVSPQPTTIRERHVFLECDDRLFELLYAASAEAYVNWLRAFRILLRTFSFIEEPQVTSFRPLVEGATVDYALATSQEVVEQEPQ